MEFDAAAHLKALLNRRSWELQKSLQAIATDAGISRSYLYKLTDGSIQSPSIKYLYRLAYAMNISPIAIFRLYDENHLKTAASKNSKNSLNSAQGLHNSLDVIALNPHTSTPHYSAVYGGEVFCKTWEIHNIGSTIWSKRKLCRVDMPPEPAKNSSRNIYHPLITLEREIDVPHTEPGEITKISINFAAPRENCTAASLWRIEDFKKSPCYDIDFLLSVVVTVFHQ